MTKRRVELLVAFLLTGCEGYLHAGTERIPPTTSGGQTGGGTSTSGGTTSGSSASASTSGSTSSSGTAGGACVPGAQPDPCAVDGQVCHVVDAGISVTFGLGTCSPPGELDPCDAAVGCADGFNCMWANPQPSGRTVGWCVRGCSSVADCPLLTTVCQPPDDPNATTGGVCFYPVCGPFGFGGVGPLYAPCGLFGWDQSDLDRSAYVGVGLCVPMETWIGTIGVCLQGGLVTSGACNGTRVDGGADLCSVGALCAVATDGGTSSCNPICAASRNEVGVDGGPACTEPGAICANVFSVQNDFGECLSACGGSGSCLTGTCTALDSTQSVCLP
jgi:hypothetical protein